ncbi:unnamed protein product [Diabrotica balteata]|uniref:Uncharacterized protein n=1 Tax=Diabrotica balteata TaxID=107213 RepID=A0A9N9SQY2_DIABA|nr:unnamed protein product [Diabrotica balteata]
MYLNSMPSTVTKETPEYLMKGVMPIRPWEDPEQREYRQVIETVQRRIRRSNEKYIQRQGHNRKRRPVIFQKGDKVMVRALRVSNLQSGVCAKLMPVFEGPYIVNNEDGVNSYELKHMDSEKIRGNLNFPAHNKRSNNLRKIKVLQTQLSDDSDVSSADTKTDSLKFEDVK